MTAQNPSTTGTESTTARSGLARRDAIKLGAAAALATTGAVVAPQSAVAQQQRNAPLKFRPDGTYKIVQFNDTQDDEQTDRRTVELMEKVLDSEQPDFVVMNGDNIAGGCESGLEMKQAMNNVVRPMEDRKIPWAITFGNHDEDSTPQGGMDEADQLDFYRSYPCNRNQPSPDAVTGTANNSLLIQGSRTSDPKFNLFLIDSGRYAPEEIAGQNIEGYPGWDWIRMNQIEWYAQTSREVEREAGRLVPALLFIHIPLWEYRFMWWGSVDGRTAADHARGVDRHGIVGERNEDECPGPFNSGMFSAILDRGDVKGVFCGHDHVNTYSGDYYGVLLGYAGNAGFGTYGLPGAERNRLRGARVFELDENTENVLVDTRMVWAKDFGIDLTADDQPMEPFPLPPHQR
ncbi:metallophosphoesterase family protein [Saccharopolyspora griseoalba]|uniref:Metallophosphoesterase family protein n=1 Tax=Saccharopolyspora griseoalba TaxID=1431848 RepID=A0ABW2LRP9_9PSEU